MEFIPLKIENAVKSPRLVLSRRKRADRETLCTPAVVCTDSLDSLSREGRVRERIRREEERTRGRDEFGMRFA